jgi:hypothetical protein
MNSANSQRLNDLILLATEAHSILSRIEARRALMRNEVEGLAADLIALESALVAKRLRPGGGRPREAEAQPQDSAEKSRRRFEFVDVPDGRDVVVTLYKVLESSRGDVSAPVLLDRDTRIPISVPVEGIKTAEQAVSCGARCADQLNVGVVVTGDRSLWDSAWGELYEASIAPKPEGVHRQSLVENEQLHL